METESIDKLFLELSQFTAAKTKRECDLETRLQMMISVAEPFVEAIRQSSENPATNKLSLEHWHDLLKAFKHVCAGCEPKLLMKHNVPDDGVRQTQSGKWSIPCQNCGKRHLSKYSDDYLWCPSCRSDCKASGHDPDEDDPTRCFICGATLIAASTDDWIEWGGGEMPVDGETCVEVRYHDGTTSVFAPAKSFNWQSVGFIIAYRVVDELER